MNHQEQETMLHKAMNDMMNLKRNLEKLDIDHSRFKNMDYALQNAIDECEATLMVLGIGDSQSDYDEHLTGGMRGSDF